MTTAEVLESMRDPGKFEQLAIRVLRCLDPDCRSLLHFGINAGGKTIPERVDALCYVPGSNPPRYVMSAFTLTAADKLSHKCPDAFLEDIGFFRKRELEPGDPVRPSTQSVDASKARLVATTGEGILSPGGPILGPGPNPAVENDDLVLTFSPPIQGFGFDLLSQSRDGQPTPL